MNWLNKFYKKLTKNVFYDCIIEYGIQNTILKEIIQVQKLRKFVPNE